ncbi:3'(2'),5'-bisphosphate nucleotidase CysQ [Blochmannia endosymbiont of Camponotus sp. C-003]|uniref:3'(2'),5'-bisphosphate nucleotidase CysQ n=1 Tax=unclassified Candidatus Blochmanniella TaxID=711328 RepID=UPI002024AD8B|nr:MULTISPECIES: 3'(2'),5'-bisphosphate nucleotidase CysQ [unclassified Candidatus Blochmannia]URJ23604.1 3'(2'),5'-bisphosphate nucleotidase CysQ [Blochmannia endosymbiont of Camponotus sp. C-003]URJ29049.1 3'(2'),5'-bisphosphate nucleotidase CysQ [Blochmannia endosymbiont of Camponotus sp. C-046]
MVEKVSYIARTAGIEIMRIYNGGLKLNACKKLDTSPITNADLFSHKVIVYYLKNLTPKIPILSEEDITRWRECRDKNCFWLIDPLDGTQEFLLRNGEFTVNIAFIEYGQPIMGVVYVPVYNVLYAADNGQVWKINDRGEYINITVRMVRDPIIVMSRRSSDFSCDRYKLYNYLKKLKNYKIVNIGSSFKFCLIAEGSAQFYPRFSCTKIWDTAAGHVIARTAGAAVNDWNGKPLHYKNIDRSFLNPGFQVSSY